MQEVKKMNEFKQLKKKKESESVTGPRFDLWENPEEKSECNGSIGKTVAVFRTDIKGVKNQQLFFRGFAEICQQTVLLVGQTNIAVSYHRRLSLLNGSMNNLLHAKPMLKKKSELLQNKDRDLFGKEYHDQIFETVKAYKQSKELLASIVFKDPPVLSEKPL